MECKCGVQEAALDNRRQLSRTTCGTNVARWLVGDLLHEAQGSAVGARKDAHQTGEDHSDEQHNAVPLQGQRFRVHVRQSDIEQRRQHVRQQSCEGYGILWSNIAPIIMRIMNQTITSC